ncbi:M20/M25/M40 family metallo-hydrolase [Herbidospora cretacea]|uniref:M20/M25/M40 family metallo-hydrolase n=1 Tax=Herbidospora cretacea TaxID=28444 RepID=UPI0004C45627|nr:M20/M25/M40 family metallo-hydrolase [Herbidospora cretacea]
MTITRSVNTDQLFQLFDLLEDEFSLGVELRQAPELGNEEIVTSQIVKDALGITPRVVSGTTFTVATGRFGGETPSVIVRAELDGLSLEENTGVWFGATNGNMHACGHDVHMAALTMLVKAVIRMSDPPARLIALFQASEERPPSGAVAVVNNASLREEAVAAVALHVQP